MLMNQQGSQSRQVATAAGSSRSWQHIRKSKQASAARLQMSGSGGGAALCDSNQNDPSQAEGDDLANVVSIGSSDWLKQRLACDLLGDSVRAPWEIDEEELFHRLAGLVREAAGAPSDPDPSKLALHQLLLSMQKQVQENAEEVRSFLEVQLVSPAAASEDHV